jgi:hypothetical protein
MWLVVRKKTIMNSPASISAIATRTVKSAASTISTLHETSGQHFAPGIEGNKKLEDVLYILDESSLSQLVVDLHR